jgi:transposase
MQMEVTMNTVINIGIDVHKDSCSLSAFTFNNHQCFGQARIASKSSLVINCVNRMKKEHQDAQVVCGYEADPTGYGLYRDLEKAGIPCAVMEPTTMPKASGSRVKNDRLDAQEIA